MNWFTQPFIHGLDKVIEYSQIILN